jgi:hypothetical protein
MLAALGPIATQCTSSAISIANQQLMVTTGTVLAADNENRPLQTVVRVVLIKHTLDSNIYAGVQLILASQAVLFRHLPEQ